MFIVIGAKRDKCRLCRQKNAKEKEGFLIKEGPVKGFICKDHFYSLAEQQPTETPVDKKLRIKESHARRTASLRSCLIVS